MSSLTFTVNKSHNSQNNWSRRQQKKKPFCKVCFDTEKPEKVYTSHFLKDRPGPNGKVICPTLLATECRYCRKNGHFKSHCPDLSQKQQTQQQQTQQQQTQHSYTFNTGDWMTVQSPRKHNETILMAKFQHKATEDSRTALGGQFGALDVMSDDEEEEEMSFVRGPSVAVAVAPQGAWGTKLVIQETPIVLKVVKKVVKPSRVKSDKEVDIETKLKQLRLDLEEETQSGSGSWADAGDIEDIEDNIAELEEELERMQTMFIC